MSPDNWFFRAAEKIHAETLRYSADSHYMCLTPAIGQYGVENFRTLLAHHGVSSSGDLKYMSAEGEGISPDCLSASERNQARIWFLLLLAESGL